MKFRHILGLLAIGIATNVIASALYDKWRAR